MRRVAIAASLACAGMLATALPAMADGDRGRGWGPRPGHGAPGHGRGGPGHAGPPTWVHPQYGPSYQVPAYYYAPRPPRPVYVVPPPVYYAPPPVVVYPGWGYPQGEVSFGLRLPLR